jgi:hypothetical protein
VTVFATTAAVSFEGFTAAFFAVLTLSPVGLTVLLAFFSVLALSTGGPFFAVLVLSTEGLIAFLAFTAISSLVALFAT